MYSANEIANYFLSKSVKENKPITNLKLQKLVYMAHGFYEALKDEDLIREEIECWPYGPVIRDLYFKYKDFKNGTITVAIEDFQNKFNFSEDALKAIDFTWNTTKDLDAIQLSNWTHIEGSPWKQAMDKNEDIVSNDSIRQYFKQFLKPKVDVPINAGA